MFGLNKKIIKYPELKKKFNSSMKSGGFMNEFTDKVDKRVGKSIFNRRIKEKEFYNALRADSKARKFGEKGFTKKSLTKFYAKMLNNKKDSFTDRKILKLAEIAGVKRSKVMNYAAEMRKDNVSVSKQGLSGGLHEAAGSEGIRNNEHIKEIIAKGSVVTYAAGANNVQNLAIERQQKSYSPVKLEAMKDGHQALETTAQNSGGKNFHDLETPFVKNSANDNSKNSHVSLQNGNPSQPPKERIVPSYYAEAKPQHMIFLKNKHSDIAGQENLEMVSIKDRLAKIQDKEDDGEKEAEDEEGAPLKHVA